MKTIDWKAEAEYLLNNYNMSAAEEEIVRCRFKETMEKFLDMDEETCETLCNYFTDWVLGEAPKARLNYWMKKTGTTVEELNI